MSGIKDKLDYLLALCRDGRVTDTEFRHLFALVIAFHNGVTGRCFPTDEALGDAVCKSARTAGEHTRGLQEKGYLKKKKMRGASRYEFLPIPTGTTPSDLDNVRSEEARSEIGTTPSYLDRKKRASRSEDCLPNRTLEGTLEDNLEGTLEGYDEKKNGNATEAKNGQAGKEEEGLSYVERQTRKYVKRPGGPQ